jgi:peptide/nickel transport system substrate-binding protein
VRKSLGFTHKRQKEATEIMMKSHALALSSGVILLGALALSGCGTTTSTAPASTQAVKGGTAVIALATQTSPNWFFPELSAAAFSDVNTQVDSMLYRPLIMFNQHDQIDYARSLVSNISSNASGTRYVLTLSHKYSWSNGHPITAQDVAFTAGIMQAATSTTAPWLYGGAGIGGLPQRWKSVTADGADKVVVTLTTPSNPQWIIHIGVGQIWPVPESVWNKIPEI